jgi:hypothetical protein
MLLRKLLTLRVSSFVVASALLCSPAFSQQDNAPSQSSSNAQDDGAVEGTIVASSRITFVVRSDDNRFHVFTFDRDTNRPRALAVGTRVRVNSDQGDQAGARHATDVTVVDQAQGAGTANSSARNAAPVPPSVRNVESQIQRDARRWRLGARAGVGLDPELIMFGIHSQAGPVFNRNVFFRPNADFAWGEITDMVALNLEAVYRIPTTTHRGEWAPYFGGGPSLNFIHQSFQTKTGQSRNISFGNFDYETGFNILMGLQNRHGTFFEVKTSLYSAPAPVLRLIVGRNF